MRIAVIGSGVTGLSCAHILGPHHDVVLFEADERPGGHANTVIVDDPEVGPIGVDTGFIVHNDRNYPNLVRLFADLQVPVKDSEMSFGVSDESSSARRRLAYRATNINTLFADRANLFSRTMWRMLIDIVRFYRHANRFLTTSRLPDGNFASNPEEVSLKEFLTIGGYSDAFVDLHLIPMGAAVWSADPATFDLFPAQSLFTFLSNHGLLGVGNRPQWRTVVGGSKVYVDAVLEAFDGEVRLSTPVRSVGADRDGCEVHTADGVERFDKVVMACHSDQALALLRDPTSDEQSLLGAIGYQDNRATLHTDTSLLPANQRAWAAWNYHRRDTDNADESRAVLTYDLTVLQRLEGSERYLVTLNSEDHIDPDKIIASFDYAHPVFDGPAIAAQRKINRIDGVSGVHFCGAWRGYGFHEDGIASAVEVCKRIGVTW